ncbi:3',5'-cyclic-nucleotide phosphodiesterase [Ferribacterium limneticum]|uniref:3',5'-cyclic-nucleotide phosphodiesterase n=1 Tax=Ferribacterium limneticum TaxID=76259 RepID=UPI001CFBBAF0|nr:3',5'-cyclic-nucleotide phosphodiesterase [Ferribacterium limneticum]UCV29283.1 3',5'-cyclic-nucleotide phosphodiesterase [Ferribacterium limneticum]UCV33202.1 3',5'-cyclic-nucleotide phosphodiesterase [Ferribacterium limneticum]
MKLRVLGCSGGIGGRHQRTTSFLLDHDILIDAGTGVAELSIAEMTAIDHVFLTHAHLDHIASLPLMIDAVGDRRSKPLTVHAIPAVLDMLRQHIFNWSIWPDFSVLPSAEQPFMRYHAIETGGAVSIDGRSITALPVDHTVPAVGYCLDSGAASLVFSGDTGPCDAFWQALNRLDHLRYLIIECAFSNQEQGLAEMSKHYCPDLLARELRKLNHRCEIHITHLKPGQVETTMAEIETCLGEFSPVMLQNNQVFDF